MAKIDVETPGTVTVNVGSRWRVLHRVPIYMRMDMKQIYDPVVVPLGPYHHRLTPQLQLVEPLKEEILVMFCGSAARRSLLLSEVCERIGEIRHFYRGAEGKDDETLAEMMLRDACFLACYMHGFCNNDDAIYKRISQQAGMSGLLFIKRDMFILENQIPLWLISLIHPDPQSLLREFLSDNVFGDHRIEELPWGSGGGGGGGEPLHLLEAFHRTHLCHIGPGKGGPRIKLQTQIRPFLSGKVKPRADNESIRTEWQKRNSPFRSVNHLRAKGIDFRESSNCMTDIKFTKAELHLPSFYFTSDSKVFFSNLITFEMSPEANTNYGVTTYFHFMKTLIDKPKDVKVLRKKGILYSRLAKDDEVVEMFKSIDTYGYSNDKLLYYVKKSIEDHCNNKTRTWMADLINTKFRSPWSVIALAAATILLGLTFLQTYYTMFPTRTKSFT